MARKKINAFDDADKPRDPVKLQRIEVRTEMVPLTDAEKVERLEMCNGIKLEIHSLESELSDLAESVKDTKTSIEAAYGRLMQSVGEAHDGHKGSDYEVIVERHPEHPAEMLVWRAPDGAIVADLLAEEIQVGDNLMVVRERQGCSLIETRAMSSEELDAAADEDHKRKHPELPIEGLDPPKPAEGKDSDLPPCDPETGVAEPAGERMSDLDDDDWAGDPPPPPAEEKPAKKAKGTGGRKARK